MKRMLIAAAVMAGSLAPMPVLAAKAETLACLTEGVPVAVRKRLAEDLLADIRQVTDEADGGSDISDDTIEAIGETAYGCKTKHGWSEPAMDAALAHAISLFSLDGATAALKEAGFDAAAVHGVFLALPAGARKGFLESPVADKSVEAYLAGVTGAGMRVETEAHGEVLGLYAGLLAVLEEERAKFLKA